MGKSAKRKQKTSAAPLETASNPLIDASIDDIFASKTKPVKKDPIAGKAGKSSKITKEPAAKIVVDASSVDAKPLKASKPANDDFADSRGAQKGRPKTEDGFLIFGTDELNIGKGGETEQCPFDCNCCF